MIPADLRIGLVAEAALAPSVHNVQPARWRFDGDGVILFEDRARRLPAGDPRGHDAALSLGAAAEGMAIALSRLGYRMQADGSGAMPLAAGAAVPVRRFRIAGEGQSDPLAAFVERRRSHRGGFAPATATDRAAAAVLGSDDLAVIRAPEALAEVARLADRAGLSFLRKADFRAELLGWMRLSRRDPRWSVDGLNADALDMTAFEAFGAKRVLGRALFPLLDRIGLAAPLTAERAKVEAAVALLIVHAPSDEDPFETGRRFYRQWLGVVAAGFQAAVMASLADHPEASARLAELLALPPNRRIVSAFRIGRAPPDSGHPRARLSPDALLV
ncbi:hypothetical protein [Sphingosinicella sp. BN140058]|uniref:hypothetical protein n=1 Tax=Sphingosinicella sp. BN140058 TaxID=1892855 RepID=UPI0010112DCE|nr:hypothetical protein [Sphingosinicella sp. BN140058]QAY78368.1 hypothetical protein ETR14_18880 [Sphingosinicella sp. BN140058]